MFKSSLRTAQTDAARRVGARRREGAGSPLTRSALNEDMLQEGKMARILKKGLLLGLAGLFLCGALGCSSSKKTTQEVTEEEQTTTGWGDETRENIMRGADTE